MYIYRVSRIFTVNHAGQNVVHRKNCSINVSDRDIFLNTRHLSLPSTSINLCNDLELTASIQLAPGQYNIYYKMRLTAHYYQGEKYVRKPHVTGKYRCKVEIGSKLAENTKQSNDGSQRYPGSEYRIVYHTIVKFGFILKCVIINSIIEFINLIIEFLLQHVNYI